MEKQLLHRVGWEIRRVLPVLGGVMLAVVMLLALTGQFGFDVDSHHGIKFMSGTGPEFGLYDRPMRGLQSYLNPTWELVAFTQFVGILLLPIVLYGFRKRLRVTVLPWVFVAVFMVGCLFLGLLNPPNNGGMYPILDSNFSWLLWIQVILAFGIGLSYSAYVAVRYPGRFKEFLRTKSVLRAGAALSIFGVIVAIAVYILFVVKICETGYAKGYQYRNCRHGILR